MNSRSGNVLFNWRQVREHGGRDGNGARGNYAIQSVFNDSLLSRLKVDRVLELGGYGEEESKSPIYALRYDRTGDFLVSGDKCGVLRLWDTRRSKRKGLVRSWNAGGGVPILCVDFLDGKQGSEKVVLSGGLNQRVCVYDSGSKDVLPLRQFSCHGGSVRSLAPVGSEVFLSAGDDGTVRQHDLRESHLCGGYGQECCNVIVSLRRRESRSRRFFLNVMFGAISTRVEVYALAAHPSESHYFVIGGSDRLVRLYDRRMPMSSEEPRVGLPLVHAWLPGEWTGRGGWWSMAQVTGLAWSYDGRRIAASYSGDRIFIIDATGAFRGGSRESSEGGGCGEKRRRDGDGYRATEFELREDDFIEGDDSHRRRRSRQQYHSNRDMNTRESLSMDSLHGDVLIREEEDQRSRFQTAREFFLSSSSSSSIFVSDPSSEDGIFSDERANHDLRTIQDMWDAMDGDDEGSDHSTDINSGFSVEPSSFYSSDSPLRSRTAADFSPDDVHGRGLLTESSTYTSSGHSGSTTVGSSSPYDLLSFFQRSSVLLFPPRVGAARSRWNRSMYGYQCWNLISMEDIRLADRRMLGVMTGHINLATKNLQVFFFGGERHGGKEYVVSGSDDGGIYIWSLSSMKIVQVLTERKDVGLVVPHPCALQLASSSNGEISFWTPIGPPTSKTSCLERNLLRAATMNNFFVENATSIGPFSRVVFSVDDASIRTSESSLDSTSPQTRDRDSGYPDLVLGFHEAPESVVVLEAPALSCIIQ